jgi:Cu2+-containing amine oxidase
MAAAEKSRYWKSVNPGVLNAVGEPVAYKPVPVHASTPLMLPLAMISRTYGPAVSPVRPWSW